MSKGAEVVFKALVNEYFAISLKKKEYFQ